MAITEHQRMLLSDAARSAFGDEPAAILMEVIVPAGEHPASRRDLTTTEARVLTRIDGFEATVDPKLVSIDVRFDEFDRRMGERFARMDDRMDAFETRMDERMTVFETRMDKRMTVFETRIESALSRQRDELVAVFRGELGAAVAGQTRLVIMSTATAIFGIGGLAITLAQVLP